MDDSALRHNMKTAKLNTHGSFSFLTMLEYLNILELMEEDNSTFFQTIAQLPKANRDTLAFLMLHLHKYALCWSG